jgi:ADP-ribosylglycohydrolase
MKTTDFELFNERSKYTDDSVLTLAIARALLIDGHPYREQVQSIGRKYPNSRYGGMFYKWLFSGSNRPDNSYGNGAAMRVSPVAYAFSTLEVNSLSAEFTSGLQMGYAGKKHNIVRYYDD